MFMPPAGGTNFSSKAEMLTFDVEIKNRPGDARLGIDVVLVSSSCGCGLVIENVNEGLVEVWNQQSSEPLIVRPGDFIKRVNGIESDISAIAQELRVPNKELLITVQRRTQTQNQLDQASLQRQRAGGAPAASLRGPADGAGARGQAMDLSGAGGAPEAAGGPPGLGPPGVGSSGAPGLSLGQGMGANGKGFPTMSAPGMQGLGGLGPQGAAPAPPDPTSQQQWLARRSQAAGARGGNMEPTGNARNFQHGYGGNNMWAQLQPGGAMRDAPGGKGEPPPGFMGAAQQATQGASEPGGSPAEQQFTFEVMLQKPEGARLGIDVLPVSVAELGGLSVKHIAKGGVVDLWNQNNREVFCITIGDCIIRVNGIMLDFPRMMEELRTNRELRITMLRRTSLSSAPQQGQLQQSGSQQLQQRQQQQGRLSAGGGGERSQALALMPPSSSPATGLGAAGAVASAYSRKGGSLDADGGLQSDGMLPSRLPFAGAKGGAAGAGALFAGGRGKGAPGGGASMPELDPRNNMSQRQTGGGGKETSGRAPPNAAPPNAEGILRFDVEVDKSNSQRLGIDVMLLKECGQPGTNDKGSANGFVVERITPNGCVDKWNQQSVSPYKVRPGDHIIEVNGVDNRENKMTHAFTSDAKKVKFTVQRMPGKSAAALNVNRGQAPGVLNVPGLRPKAAAKVPPEGGTGGTGPAVSAGVANARPLPPGPTQLNKNAQQQWMTATRNQQGQAGAGAIDIDMDLPSMAAPTEPPMSMLSRAGRSGSGPAGGNVHDMIAASTMPSHLDAATFVPSSRLGAMSPSITGAQQEPLSAEVAAPIPPPPLPPPLPPGGLLPCGNDAIDEQGVSGSQALEIDDEAIVEDILKEADDIHEAQEPDLPPGLLGFVQQAAASPRSPSGVTPPGLEPPLLPGGAPPGLPPPQANGDAGTSAMLEESPSVLVHDGAVVSRGRADARQLAPIGVGRSPSPPADDVGAGAAPAEIEDAMPHNVLGVARVAAEHAAVQLQAEGGEPLPASEAYTVQEQSMAKLVAATQDLKDDDLSHLLRKVLSRRPWLQTPVHQALQTLKATHE